MLFRHCSHELATGTPACCSACVIAYNNQLLASRSAFPDVLVIAHALGQRSTLHSPRNARSNLEMSLCSLHLQLVLRVLVVALVAAVVDDEYSICHYYDVANI